jgi:signal transduction histidine kinase
MNDETSAIDYQKRYLALSRLAVSGAAGEPVGGILQTAVEEAVALVGLVAGAVRIFGAGEEDLASTLAGENQAKTRMQELENTLLGQLRRTYAVRSLYMTLDLDGPAGLFSYPLKSGDQIIGAISGIARGERNLATEEQFVATLAAIVVLIGRASGQWTDIGVAPTAAAEDAIKTKAVQETAAAINHEVNNPLMAVMGNVELLLRKKEELSPEALDKLQKIQDAAARIRRVTQDLMRITSARSTPYPGGTSMIDIDGSPKGEE